MARDSVLEKTYHRIAEKIASNCNKAFLVIVSIYCRYCEL